MMDSMWNEDEIKKRPRRATRAKGSRGKIEANAITAGRIGLFRFHEKHEAAMAERESSAFDDG
jgi:hypothetical protein